MNSLINLVIGFVMSLFLGNQLEEPKAVHQEIKKDSIEIFQQLQVQQKILDC